MFWDYPLRIQAHDTKTKQWYHKDFETKEEFKAYVWSQFKTPGQYNLSNTSEWQSVGDAYTVSVTKPNFEGGSYTKAIKGTHVWKNFWNNEKDKVLKGVIYDGVYIPPFYYWYLNFCPIYDDEKKKKRLGDIWDSDLWFFQYIMLCVLEGKHAVVVKARQRGYSFKIMALLYWCYCWFEGSINTIGASHEDYVKKSWRFLEFYRKHINENTAWKRGPVRPKSLEWFERTETAQGSYLGLDSKISGTTFQISPENGVGGSQTCFFYEEAGIAPTMLKTLGYVRPALEKGNITTGLIICSGAVGELDDAEDLQSIFYQPTAHNFLGIPNIWDEDASPIDTCGLFVSEAYNLKGFIDADGNSLVEEALDFIKKKADETRKGKKVALAQLDISQKPTSPKEAFAQRDHSYWPIEAIARQQQILKIKQERGELKHKKGLLYRDTNGQVKLKSLRDFTRNPPTEMIYPVDPKIVDKRGVTTIYQDPNPNVEFYVNFGGVDTIEMDVTTESESLFSIYIISRLVEVHTTDEEGKEKVHYEGGNILASYVGRFDTAEETNDQGLMLLELYRGKAAVERNKPNFINQAKKESKQKYLLEKSEIQLYKDVDTGADSRGEYGIYFAGNDDGKAEQITNMNTKDHILSVIDVKSHISEDGKETIFKKIRYIDFIEDYWLLEEMRLNKKGKNADRLRSYGLAVTAVKSFENSYKKVEYRQEEAFVTPKKKKLPTNILGAFSSPKKGDNKIKRRSII